MGLDLVRTNVHKVFIVLVYMPVSLAAYALNGKVDWWTGAVLAAGMSIGGWVGARLSLGKGGEIDSAGAVRKPDGDDRAVAARGLTGSARSGARGAMQCGPNPLE